MAQERGGRVMLASRAPAALLPLSADLIRFRRGSRRRVFDAVHIDGDGACVIARRACSTAEHGCGRGAGGRRRLPPAIRRASGGEGTLCDRGGGALRAALRRLGLGFPAELAPIAAATEIETTIQIAGRDFYVGRLGG